MRAFERVTLGTTGVTVTRLGLGAAPLGGLYQAVGDGTARATVDAAWDAGIRLFDTAPLYGAGLSERRLGAALATRPRGQYTLCTKVGRRLVATSPATGSPDAGGDSGDGEPAAQPELWAEPGGWQPVWDFTAPGVRASLAESLDRLGLDRVDVLHLHDPDEHFAAALEQARPELVALRREGRIGAVSAGMNQSAMLTEFARTGDFDCFLLAGRYSLLDQSGLADLLPECAARGISVLVGGVYNSGVLADPSSNASYDYGPAPAPILARARAIRDVCDRHGVPLRAAALQFPFGHPAVAGVLVGMRSPTEVADAVTMSTVDIPGQLWRDLVRAGLLPEGVPTP